VGGGVSDVKKLAVGDLVQFHARFWRPESSALIVVGEVEPADVRASAERHFRAFRPKRGAEPPKVVLPPPPKAIAITIVDRPGAVQSAVFAAHRFPPRSAPGFEARELLGSLVGGLFTSRINLNLREEHAYTYGARGKPVATRHWGAFIVQTSVRTDVTAPALEELLEELRKARDPSLGAPITTAEIERARSDLLHTLGARLEHTTGVADAVKTAFVSDLGDDYHSRYPALIAAVDAGDVAESAKLLKPEHLLVVIAGDRARIAPDLARLGAVESASEALVD